MTRHRAGIAVGLRALAFLVFYLVVRLLFVDSLGAAVAEAQVRSVADILANGSVPAEPALGRGAAPGVAIAAHRAGHVAGRQAVLEGSAGVPAAP